MRKPRVAIIRGPGLSKWEMQIYEPLTRWFDLTVIGATEPLNDTTGISFPIVNLSLKWTQFKKLPRFKDIMFSILGDTQWLENFDATVKGMDLLHTVELRNGYTLQAAHAKKQGLVKAVTVTVYENIPFIGDEYPKRKQIKDDVIPYMDHFLAANEVAKHSLLAEGVDQEKVTIIPQSVDTSRFAPIKYSELSIQSLKKKYGLIIGDFVVLGVGRMVWEKGWYDIVRAARQLNSKLERIKFLCVGGGPELKNLQQMVGRLGLSETVKFTGSIPYRDMPDVFRLADVFVQASLPTRTWNEQFGGVLIEAMASGLPIIGTLNGGIKDTVSPGGGIFSPPQSFSELALVISKLYKNSKLRAAMGNFNRKRAESLFDVKIVAEKIKKTWLTVLDKNR